MGVELVDWGDVPGGTSFVWLSRVLGLVFLFLFFSFFNLVVILRFVS